MADLLPMKLLFFEGFFVSKDVGSGLVLDGWGRFGLGFVWVYLSDVLECGFRELETFDSEWL